ncbi:hypothetical protein F5884DRAFT_901488 [Xylogone sp. PMI_703]|nr:hypothetical protein F5884DRAFT_901488 [Xylogone sp. PMI_703]
MTARSPSEVMKSEDNHDSSDLSREDSNPLLAQDSWDEEADRVPKRKTRTSKAVRVLSAVLSLRYFLDTILLISILAFLVATRDSNKTELETSGDITGFAPKIRRQIKSFAHDSSYTPDDPADWFTNRVRQKWLDLVPKGLGYVRIDNVEDYDNLPTPLPEYDYPVFTTSVTHQLHCLYKLQELYSSLVSNNTGGKVHESSGWHSGHCFEYLRQSIMCCGDTALEGKQTSFPSKDHPGSDGWDAKHICRDYNQIYTYLEANGVDDQEWI